MDYKWIGAVLIVAASACFGFSLSGTHRREEQSLRILIGALDYMSSELHFRAPSLPELCRGAAGAGGKGIDRVFLRLTQLLEESNASDVSLCMESALQEVDLPLASRENLHLLGKSLGHFDLEGQLKGLDSVRTAARRDLDKLTQNREQRLRNYQTLSVCGGAALAILLI